MPGQLVNRPTIIKPLTAESKSIRSGGSLPFFIEEGFLITAYPTDKIKEGERIWIK